MRRARAASAATVFAILLAACGGGSDSGTRAPATASTLAYVVTECHGDADGGSIRQRLQIRRGDQAPITVVEHAASGITNARLSCNTAGVQRQSTYFSRYGVFHRLGVTPDGSEVIFEVSDDDVWTLFPRNTMPAEQEGFFVVRADGTGLRRLSAASREPPYENLGFPGILLTTNPRLFFSPNGRTFAYTDRGPSRDGDEAVQVFTLDIAGGQRLQVTDLPPASPSSGNYCGPVGCPFFTDDETITFYTAADVDGTNPDGKSIIANVKADGSQPATVLPAPIAIPGGAVEAIFQITGAKATGLLVTVEGTPVNAQSPTDRIVEVFVSDGDNVLQLTDFRRRDVFNPTVSVDGSRVFFAASANPPSGSNPTENCQIFSIDRTGGDLRQLTDFSEGAHSETGCLFGVPPLGCTAFFMGRDTVNDALVFYSSCDPFGTNAFGSQVFAMHQDGTGLQQLTMTRGYTRDADRSVTVEMAFPFAFPLANP